MGWGQVTAPVLRSALPGTYDHPENKVSSSEKIYKFVVGGEARDHGALPRVGHGRGPGAFRRQAAVAPRTLSPAGPCFLLRYLAAPGHRRTQTTPPCPGRARAPGLEPRRSSGRSSRRHAALTALQDSVHKSAGLDAIVR